MKYSFKKGRSKSLFKKDTKFWIAFLVVSVGVLISLQIALSMKLSGVIEDIKTTRLEKEALVKKTNMVRADFADLKDQIAYANRITSSNTLLKDSMKNLFEIVPDKIILTKIEMTPSVLTIFGTTPSRDIFNLQFAPALKSIFTKSETSFIRGENGNSRFISINYIEQKDEVVTQDDKHDTQGQNANKNSTTEAHKEH